LRQQVVLHLATLSFIEDSANCSSSGFK
jgi:hypothetical protein